MTQYTVLVNLVIISLHEFPKSISRAKENLLTSQIFSNNNEVRCTDFLFRKISSAKDTSRCVGLAAAHYTSGTDTSGILHYSGSLLAELESDEYTSHRVHT